MNQIDFLEMYLGLYIDHFSVLKALEEGSDDMVILDIRNAPAQLKKEQIKGANALPAKTLNHQLAHLDKDKTYVIYDWNSGTILGKTALLALYKAGFTAYEMAGAFEGWKGMNLPTEPVLPEQ